MTVTGEGVSHGILDVASLLERTLSLFAASQPQSITATLESAIDENNIIRRAASVSLDEQEGLARCSWIHAEYKIESTRCKAS